MLTLAAGLVYLLITTFTLLVLADNVRLPLRVCTVLALVWPITVPVLVVSKICQLWRLFTKGY